MFSQIFVFAQGKGVGVGFPACITGHMTSMGGLASKHASQVTWPGAWGSAARGQRDVPTGEGSSGQTQPTRTRKTGGTHPTGMLPCFKKSFMAGGGGIASLDRMEKLLNPFTEFLQFIAGYEENNNNLNVSICRDLQILLFRI